MRSLKRIAIIAVLAFGIGFGAAACGSDDTPVTECFDSSEVNPQIQQYMDDPANQATIQTAASGVKDVCVVDRGAMHYYNQQDNFADFALYAMMAGRVHPLIGAGVIMGDLDPIQAFILTNLLVSPNASGYYYHPYQRVGNTYRPSTTVIKNYRVTNVYYGNSARPISYSKYLKSKSPAGYTRPTFKPSDTTLKADKTGKVTSVSGVKASDVIKNGGKLPTNTNKGVTGGTNKNSNPNKGVTAPKPPTVNKPANSYTYKPSSGFNFKGK